MAGWRPIRQKAGSVVFTPSRMKLLSGPEEPATERIAVASRGIALPGARDSRSNREEPLDRALSWKIRELLSGDVRSGRSLSGINRGPPRNSYGRCCGHERELGFGGRSSSKFTATSFFS